MSRVLVTGSLVYDNIMNFPGSFKDHILPDKVHILNVSFLVDNLHKNFGGTAGNIAYNLSLLGLSPMIMASAGRDFWEYESWLKANEINFSYVKVHNDEYCAQAYITTDKDDNQITAFHPGAMNYANRLSMHDIKEKPEIVIVAPNDKQAMIKYMQEAKELRIEAIFDPGQQIPTFSDTELKHCLKLANYIVVNDYELELILEKTKLSQSELLDHTKALLVTKGNEGSVIHDSKGSYKIPAFSPKKIVDPTGCGDAYRAGIIYGLLSHMSLEKAGRVASLLAANKISSPGGQNHKIELSEFKRQFKDWTGEEL